MGKNKLNLVLLLLILVPSIAATAPRAKAQATTIYVNPQTTIALLETSFNVNITIANVANLAEFEFKLYWNTTVLNFTFPRMLLPWSLYSVTRNETREDFNATHGRYWLEARLSPPALTFDGTATVLIAKFLATAPGISKIDLVDTAMTDAGAQLISHTVTNGQITVSVHDIAITQVSVAQTTTFPGGIVNINVTASNFGFVTETFGVVVYVDSAVIGTHSVDNLSSDTDRLLSFAWNTAGTVEGNYTIRAQANQLPEEADTTNNVRLFSQFGIRKIASAISVSADPAFVAAGSDVTISGVISPPRSGVDVEIEIRSFGAQAFVALASIKTNSSGWYSHQVKTKDVGAFELRASWQGDAATNGATSDIQGFNVAENKTDFVTYIVAIGVVVIVLAAVLYFWRIRKPGRKRAQ